MSSPPVYRQTDRQTDMADTLKATYWGPCTINNPTDDDRARLSEPNWPEWVKGVRGQDEVGENGTPHIQFMVICKAQQRLSALKKWLPRAHLEAARNVKAVQAYVSKTDTAVEGTRFERTNEAFYVTPAQFPRWLRSEWDALLDDKDVPPHQMNLDTALEEAAFTVAYVTRKGLDVAHLWSQASLRRVTVDLWTHLSRHVREEDVDVRLDASADFARATRVADELARGLKPANA